MAVMAGILLFQAQPWAQKPPETEAEFEKGYQQRIQLEYIDGVYIPKDLSDALIQLNKLAEPESKEKFKNASEDEAVNKLHFSLGRWIALNWGFYEGSRLSHSLKGMGVHHPEDMARLLIRSFHRSLNKNPIAMKEQLAAIAEKQERELKERIERGTILYEEKRKVKKDSIER